MKVALQSRLALFTCSLTIGLFAAPVRPIIAQSPAKEPIQEVYKQGHSRHGDAFDVGPRQKPWVMEGIGKAHFPISTSVPEVQMWFDQGHALLHSFWYYEAERAFRWCVKLDPECAMAYWGLARSAADGERAASFIREAARRKQKVSERERLYIEAWEALYGPAEPKDPAATGEADDGRRERFRYLLEKLTLKYPDDLEAKSLFALENLGKSRYGTDLILQQVLAKDPRHPGAHHYRIHNWDGKEGDYALDSCRLFGAVAPYVGHAQHMPGHVYSGVGMWHEAAIAMDSATRVEKQYMRQRMIFPFNNWNYAHNRNYLSYIQEQLGMAEAAIDGAKQLLAAPRDPKYDNPDQYGTQWQGTIALMRALIKFERWGEMLAPKTFFWGNSTRDKMYKAYCETLAHIGLHNLDKASKTYAAHSSLIKELEKSENKWLGKAHGIQSVEMRALLALEREDSLDGLGLLAEAAKRELERREDNDDPPDYPNVLYNTLGRAYLGRRSPSLAALAFEKALEAVRNDGFALSGLVEAHAAMGDTDKAREAYGRLLYVWSDADPGLKWLERARAAGVEAKPRDTSPAKQRNYRTTTLDHYGPNTWEPYQAPVLDALDSKGKRVTLEDYRGKNVLLIFYLGQECPHCLEQLVQVTKKKDEFSRLDTDVLAISSNTPQENAASVKVGELPFRLLSDAHFENARRFKSFDDFEDIALHSTILIDRRGRVHWARTGGDPFTDFEFLLKEIKQLNEIAQSEAKVRSGTSPRTKGPL